MKAPCFWTLVYHYNFDFMFRYFKMKCKKLYLPSEALFIKILWPLYCGKDLDDDDEQVMLKLNGYQ